MRRTIQALAGTAAAIALLAGCTVKKQEAPALSGPSVLATSLQLTANPDTLRQDGASQSQIVILALDANSQPVRNLPVRVEVSVGGVVMDFGQVSAKNVVTGADGRASLVYTAPNAPADPVDFGTIVQILATPTGTDYANATTRVVNIRLVPPGIILPPNGTPVPQFSFSPSAAVTFQDVLFDATQSSDPDGTIVAYDWTFGDGTTGTGATVRHQYRQAGTFTVTLKVTDDRGYAATLARDITVAASQNPTAAFSFSPTSPRPREDVVFNASASRAATGRTLTSYAWDFGNGSTGTGVTATTSFALPGAYNVTLTVTDDVGNRGTTSSSVTVQASAITANFTFSPAAPAKDQSVYFDASTSTVGLGRTITNYDWTFGDGATAAGRTVNHTYATEGTFAVVLRIRDDLGQTASTTRNVTVQGGAVVVKFTYSPTDPKSADTVYFNASESFSPFGISRFAWDFGDGATLTKDNPGDPAFALAEHKFPALAAARTYTVRLTVTDNQGRTSTLTKDVKIDP